MVVSEKVQIIQIVPTPLKKHDMFFGVIQLQSSNSRD